MAEFNLDRFLMENGFSFTNYGIASDKQELYEIEKDDHHYCVNLQNGKMTTNQSRTKELLVDLDIPKNQAAAEKWLNEFLGGKAKAEKPTKD